jgi:hypothetical protein
LNVLVGNLRYERRPIWPGVLLTNPGGNQIWGDLRLPGSLFGTDSQPRP